MDLMTLVIYAAVVIAVVVIGVPLIKLVFGIVAILITALGVCVAVAIKGLKKKLLRRKE